MPVHEALRSWLAAYPNSHPQARHFCVHGGGIILAWLGLLGLFLPVTIDLATGPELSVSLTLIMAATVYAALFTLPLAMANAILLALLLIPWIVWSRSGADTALPASLLLLAGFLLLTVGQERDRPARQRIGNALIALNALPRGLFWLLSRTTAQLRR